MFALNVRAAIAASALFIFVSTVPACADEFSWQLSGTGARSEVADRHFDSSSLNATYYLNPVDDSGGPLALASFLHPTTRLLATASDVGDPQSYTLGGRYVLPGAHWYAGADYAWANLHDPASPFAERSDPSGYRLVGGRYFGASTTLELAMGDSKERTRTMGFCQPAPAICPPATVAESSTASWSLDTLHVGKLRALPYSVGGEVRQSKTDIDITLEPGSVLPVVLPDPDSRTLTNYSISGELFPTDRLGVKLDYSRPDGSADFDVDGYTLMTTWFFTRRVAMQVAFGRSTLHDLPSGPVHTDSAVLSFTGRL